MSDLRELYQEVILDHNKTPRNFGRLDSASHQAEGFNPLCGDKVEVFAQVSEGVIEELRFHGEGCAISTAAASMLTEAVRGKPVAEARDLFACFVRMVTGKEQPGDEDQLGKLVIFGGLRDFPTRVKCATLVWHTLGSALDGEQTEGSPETVTTE